MSEENTATEETVTETDNLMEAFMLGKDITNMEETAPAEETTETPENATEEVTTDNDDFVSPLDKKDDTATPETKNEELSFEEETERKLKEMETDPHPGVKFKELREELKALKAEKNQWGEAKQDTEETQRLRDELEALKASYGDYDELKQTAALNDYTKTPEYEQQITKPFTEIAEFAELLEQHAGLEKGDILLAISNESMSKQNEAIDAIAGSLDQRTLSQVNDLANKMAVLYRRDVSIKQGAAEKLQAYQERQASEAGVKQEQNMIKYGASVDSTFDQFQTKIPSLLNDTGEKSELYGTALDKAKTLNFSEMDDDSKAYAAMAATLLPTIVKDLKTYQNALKDEKARVASLRAAKPGATNGTVTSPQAKQGVPDNAYEQFLATGDIS